jgi:hypothetical protein
MNSKSNGGLAVEKQSGGKNDMTGSWMTRRRLNDQGEWESVSVYYLDGKEVGESEFRAAFPDCEEVGDFGVSTSWKRPIHSEALGIHPMDIEAAQRAAENKGVPTSYDTEGRPIFTSRQHRARFLKMKGYHARNSYGRD